MPGSHRSSADTHCPYFALPARISEPVLPAAHPRSLPKRGSRPRRAPSAQPCIPPLPTRAPAQGTPSDRHRPPEPRRTPPRCPLPPRPARRRPPVPPARPVPAPADRHRRTRAAPSAGGRAAARACDVRAVGGPSALRRREERARGRGRGPGGGSRSPSPPSPVPAVPRSRPHCGLPAALPPPAPAPQRLPLQRGWVLGAGNGAPRSRFPRRYPNAGEPLRESGSAVPAPPCR